MQGRRGRCIISRTEYVVAIMQSIRRIDRFGRRSKHVKKETHLNQGKIVTRHCENKVVSVAQKTRCEWELGSSGHIVRS